jgi:hypothetical protein
MPCRERLRLGFKNGQGLNCKAADPASRSMATPGHTGLQSQRIWPTRVRALGADVGCSPVGTACQGLHLRKR